MFGTLDQAQHHAAGKMHLPCQTALEETILEVIDLMGIAVVRLEDTAESCQTSLPKRLALCQ